MLTLLSLSNSRRGGVQWLGLKPTLMLFYRSGDRNNLEVRSTEHYQRIDARTQNVRFHTFNLS